MTDQTVKLPTDAEGQDLGWHAMNYRTAHTIHAELMWLELERYVKWAVSQAVLEERERCAKLCEDEGRLEGSYDAAHYTWCAAAIRGGKE